MSRSAKPLLTPAANAAAEFQKAFADHQKGRIERAARGYKRALKAQPDHAAALHCLGIIDLQRGNNERAAGLLEQAVKAAPEDATAHYNLGRARSGMGDISGAIAAYDKAIELNPADPDPYLNKANLLASTKQSQAALEAYDKVLAIDPEHESARFGRARALMALDATDEGLAGWWDQAHKAKGDKRFVAFTELGVRLAGKQRLLDASNCFREALDVKPDDHGALFRMGAVMSELGDGRSSLEYLDQIKDQSENNAGFWAVYGISLSHMRRIEEMEQAFERALELDPGSALHRLNLGGSYMRVDDYEKAIEVFEELIKEEPGNASAWNNLGDAYYKCDEYAKAIDALTSAIKADPECAPAYLNLGLVLNTLGDMDNAILAMKQAMARRPDYYTAGWNLSLMLLARGEIADGWDLYGHGFNLGARQPNRHPAAPLWNGEDISGKTIMVWREQGLGDDLRFASMYNDLIKVAGKVVIETDPRLVSLYTRSFPDALVRTETRLPGDREALPEADFDVHTPAGQLGRFFRRTLEDFPEEESYLVPDPERVAYWRAKVEAAGPGIRVGFAWRSGLRTRMRNRVYTTLDDWAGLLKTPGLTFINLQYDDTTDERGYVEEKYGVTIHNFEEINLRNDLDEAAALTKACDLVISSGVSVADMAGATGVPLLFYGNARHAMQLGTQGYPWHPASRFYGREASQPIAEVAAQITADVQNFVEAHNAAIAG